MSPVPALPAELTIYTVGELHPQWLAWLDEPQGGEMLAVDAAAVAEVDAAGLQLLQSLARSLGAQQRQLRLTAPSATLQSACEGLGLQALLTAPGKDAVAALAPAIPVEPLHRAGTCTVHEAPQ